MATNTNINFPQSEFLDAMTRRPAREWMLWLMSPSVISINSSTALGVTSGGTGLSTIPTAGQLLIGNNTGYTLATLTPGAGIGVANTPGAIALANTGVLSWSGGLTGLTPSAATTGAVTLAGTLGAGYGGTGLASYAVGDLLYASGATALSQLADVATGNALISGGVTTAPAWGKIGLTTHVSGILPIANGGTNGTAAPTAGAVPYGTGTAYAFTAIGTAGQVLTSAAAGTPTWTTPTTGTVTSVTGTAPVVSSGGTTPAISMPVATTSVNGYLSSTDWTTFNGKQPAGTYVNSVSGTAGRVTSTGGVTPVIDLASGIATPGTTGSATLIPVVTIDTYGRVTGITTAANPQGTVTSVTGTAPVVSSGGATPAISMAAATSSVNGYLTSTDWSTFNAKQPVAAPVTKTADFTVAATDIWLINNKATSTCTVTLPTASTYTGRKLTIKNLQAFTVISASSNVVPIDSTSAGTAILLDVVGNWATLVSDGTNWVIMQQASNNNLLLE